MYFICMYDGIRSFKRFKNVYRTQTKHQLIHISVFIRKGPRGIVKLFKEKQKVIDVSKYD